MNKLSAKGKMIIFFAVGIVFIITGVALLSQGGKNSNYIIKFDYNNGEVKEMLVAAGGKLTKPEDPVKEGYLFEGWENNGELFDFSNEINGDISLTPRWKKIEDLVKVTFNPDNGSESITKELEKGGVVEKIANPVKEGYIFRYWDYNGTEYDFEQPVEGDIELKAVYEVAQETIVVSFDSDGGSSVDSQTINKGTTVSKPANPTKSGFIFVEWQLNGKAFNFGSNINENITLKASWIKDAQYTVTFDSNGGSNVASQTVSVTKTASKPANPTRSGFTFVEWQLNGKKYNFNTKVMGDITLKAVWDTKKYEVVFDSTGGSGVGTQYIEENKTASQPAAPTREGYTFKGWFLNDQPYDFNKPVNSNITIRANWQINTYTVTFNTNGAGDVTTQTIEYGGKVTRPADPSKEGFVFLGWNCNGVAYDFNSPVKGSFGLVANYREKTYTFKVSTIDEYSPDRTISVYEEGSRINFASIKVDGVELCNGSNPTVSKYEIEGVTTVTVVLTGGREVTARLS